MESIIAKSSTRVATHTNKNVNRVILKDTVSELEKVGFDSQKINNRLQELDREWDIERAIEANAASLALIGLALGATLNKKWFILPTVVAGFLLQHAVQGWCPPIPILRRLGFRTPREIENERAILIARRGDFEKIKNVSSNEALNRMNDQ